MLFTTPAPHLVRREFLSTEDHAALLAWSEAHEAEFVPARVKNAVHEDFRRSLVMSNLGPFAAIFKRAAKEHYKEWIGELRNSDFRLEGLELEIVAHGDGAHFATHIDTITGAAMAERKSHRVLSAVYYFFREPKGFSGGQLRLYPLGGPGNGEHFTDIEPEQNLLVVFPSWASHEVIRIACPTKAFMDSRFAINCWLHQER